MRKKIISRQEYIKGQIGQAFDPVNKYYANMNRKQSPIDPDLTKPLTDTQLIVYYSDNGGAAKFAEQYAIRGVFPDGVLIVALFLSLKDTLLKRYNRTIEYIKGTKGQLTKSQLMEVK